MRTRVKICGLSRQAEVAAAVEAGSDALGFVFHPASPRYVEPEQARALCQSLPAFVTSVALFMDHDAEQVRRIIGIMRPGLLQFHGKESAAFCKQFDLPYIKSVPMGSGVDPAKCASEHADAAGLLLDSNAIGEPGGSGKTLNLNGLALPEDARCILAGGLTPENVGEFVQATRPYAVDVSSGVESSPGVKCAQRIKAFVAAVTRADGA